mmetsp:Transcript_12550/g.29914  ORF Transcript_12550/g.29914 Transcript_12550/m.29914 type:complete len:327 (+) Transcript_12550:286-1266(+)
MDMFSPCQSSSHRCRASVIALSAAAATELSRVRMFISSVGEKTFQMPELPTTTSFVLPDAFSLKSIRCVEGVAITPTSLAIKSPMEREMVRPGMVSSPFHTLISPNSPSCTSSDAATRPPAATIRLRSLATEGKWSTVNDSMGVVASIRIAFESPTFAAYSSFLAGRYTRTVPAAPLSASRSLRSRRTRFSSDWKHLSSQSHASPTSPEGTYFRIASHRCALHVWATCRPEGPWPSKTPTTKAPSSSRWSTSTTSWLSSSSEPKPGSLRLSASQRALLRARSEGTDGALSTGAGAMDVDAAPLGGSFFLLFEEPPPIAPPQLRLPS